jgi:hypothetical protein
LFTRLQATNCHDTPPFVGLRLVCDQAIRPAVWRCVKIWIVLQWHHSCSKKSARGELGASWPPQQFHVRITQPVPAGCTDRAPGRHVHTAIVEASVASAELFSLSRAQRARAPCDQLSGSFPVFNRVCSGLLGQRKQCGRWITLMAQSATSLLFPRCKLQPAKF